MEVAAVIREAESSEEFREWKKENPDAHLTSAFSMFSEGEERNWLVSYYNRKKDTITTFFEENSKEEEAFKKEGDIPELRLEDVKLGEENALEEAKKVLSEEYGEKPQKVVMVLQNLGGEALWNMTFITAAFKIVNVRVSASTGKLISHNAASISDFMQK